MIDLLIIIGIVGFITFATLYLIDAIKRKKRGDLSSLNFGSSKKNTFSVRMNKNYQKAYTVLSRIPIIKGLVGKIRKRIETLAIYDEYSLRREVMKIVFTIASLLIFIVFILLFSRPSLLIVFWILLGITFLTGLLIDFFVYRVEARLLVQIKDFINRVRYFYQQTKMIDEAVYESIPHVGPEMRVQANRIYEILTSVNPDVEMAKYEEVSPSRFLKVIAGLAELVKEQGDVINDEGSAFLKGLSSVNEELNAEILYRSKLSYRLRGLSVFALIPVFLALPIQKWAISTFPIMQSFYDSRLGFLAEVLVYGISLLAYLLIRKMREINEAKYKSTVKRFKWEEWSLKKIPFLRKLVSAFEPIPYSKGHYKLMHLLKEANSPLKIEWFTLQRMVLALSITLLLITGLWYGHAREAKSTLFTVVPESLFAGNVTEEDRLAFEKTTAFDRRVIAEIQQVEGLTPDILQVYVAEQLGIDEVSDPKVKQATERIINKWLVVENAFLKWWEVLLAVVIGYIMWQLPKWILYFQRSFRIKDLENEVHQYLVLISILREFDRMSVYTILTWLDRFGVVFKDSIQETIQIFDSGPEEALDKLGNKVSFDPFTQIVERLKLTITRLSIKEAFADIDMEREFYLEQRKESNHRSLEIKAEWANLLGMTPTFILIFLYLVSPLLYLSVGESQEIMNQIK